MVDVIDDFRMTVEGWIHSDHVEYECLARLAVTAGNHSICEVEDLLAKTVRRDIRVSAYDLALWLVSNWWRLRWEPEKRDMDWRMCHEVGAIGGGFAWPALTFVSDGTHIRLLNKSTNETPCAPIRYLRDISLHVSIAAFEGAVDTLIETVLSRLASLGISGSDLAGAAEELTAERADADLSAYRRLEALLGFDAGEAPDDLVETLRDQAGRWGEKAVEEAAAAKGRSAVDLLRSIEEQIPTATSVEFQQLLPTSARDSSALLPWQAARVAAGELRQALSIPPDGPITSVRLTDLLTADARLLREAQAASPTITAGYRPDGSGRRLSVMLKSRYETGRRFEIARILGDLMIAPSDEALLPVTNSKTSRQKFQRAFAQELLCPWSALSAFVGPGPDEPDDELVENAAEHFKVSTWLVVSTLVNNGRLPRYRLAA